MSKSRSADATVRGRAWVGDALFYTLFAALLGVGGWSVQASMTTDDNLKAHEKVDIAYHAAGELDQKVTSNRLDRLEGKIDRMLELMLAANRKGD